MPRAYTIATAALALDMSTKWLDNTLSHHRIAGVVQYRQGIARRLTVDGLLILSLALALSKELSATVAGAIKIAQKLVATGGVYVSPDGMRIELDLEAFRTRLLARLEVAVEAAPLPRRGRPPKNTTGRLD